MANGVPPFVDDTFELTISPNVLRAELELESLLPTGLIISLKDVGFPTLIPDISCGIPDVGAEPKESRFLGGLGLAGRKT